MATWPASVPFLNSVPTTVSGPHQSVLRSAMDVGPAKARRRMTTGVYTITGRTRPMTEAQRDTFLAFHDSTLAGGVLPFQATDPVGGGVKTFRITGPYALERNGGGFVLQMSVEIVP